jgi:hypothetical protein
MSVTIFYRHRRRPNEAGMSRVDEAHVPAMKAHLENGGFLVVEIVPAPNSKPPLYR